MEGASRSVHNLLPHGNIFNNKDSRVSSKSSNDNKKHGKEVLHPGSVSRIETSDGRTCNSYGLCTMCVFLNCLSTLFCNSYSSQAFFYVRFPTSP